MSDQSLRVAVILGSNRRGRFCPVVGGWIAGLVEEHEGLRPDVIDLGELDVHPVINAEEQEQRLAAATEVLDRADAFVIVTPEYNHSFPGTLKNFIDAHFTEWRAKPVAFVSYGGRAGGQRAVEHLRAVFSELHAMTIRETVSLHNPWERFDPGNDQEAAAAAKVMLDQLAWWGHALRDARAVRPYSA